MKINCGGYFHHPELDPGTRRARLRGDPADTIKKVIADRKLSGPWFVA